MGYWEKKLIREQLDKKISSLRTYVSSGGRNIEWIRAVREALGMTSSDLARKVGVNQSRIIHMEKAEKEGNLKLITIKKIANSLGMEFVYGFVPQSSLENMVREQAKRKAIERMTRLSQTMRLELQHLTPNEQEKALKDMIDKMLMDSPKDFWKI